MKVVFDASALLALLNKESGYMVAEKYLSQAMMSTINLAEVLTVLIGIGISHSDAVTMTTDLIDDIVPFDAEQAFETACLREKTKAFGLSLGDRACLALAQRKHLTVITADKIWKEIGLPIEIIVIR
jgi:ribonuclease VapC